MNYFVNQPIGRGASMRFLLACSILLYPFALAKAADPGPDSHLTPQSIAALTIRPAAILEEPSFDVLPIEIAEAACQKYLGISAASINRVTVVIEPPLGFQPFYAVVVDLDEAMSLDGFHEEIREVLAEQTTDIELNGRTCLQNNSPEMPSLYMPNEKTLVAAPMGMIKKLLAKGVSEKDKPLARAMLKDGGAENHLHAAVQLEQLQPLIDLALMQAKQKVEPRHQKYLNAYSLVRGATLSFDFSGSRPSRLSVYTKNSEDADALNSLIDDAFREFMSSVFEDPEKGLAKLDASEGPVERASADYLRRLAEIMLSEMRPTRIGEKRFDLLHIEEGELGDRATVVIAILRFAAAIGSMANNSSKAKGL